MSDALLGALAGVALVFLPWCVARVIEAFNAYRDAKKNRPLSALEQYAVMRRRKHDTMRQLRAVARDYEEGR